MSEFEGLRWAVIAFLCTWSLDTWRRALGKASFSFVLCFLFIFCFKTCISWTESLTG